jgi:hypothetical protein
MTAFCDIALCSRAEVYRRFRGVYCLHDQGDDEIQSKAECNAIS